MGQKRVRVTIPKNTDQLVELGENIVAKHNEDPATSPLGGLDMAEFEAKVVAAKAKGVEAKKLRKDAETATEDRNHLLGTKKDQNSTTEGTVLNYVTRTRDILLGLNKGKEQHLGDFGFEVNQSSSSSGGSGDSGGTPPPPTATTGTINLMVTNQVSMNGIAGAFAEVLNTGVLGTTDASGYLVLSNVPSGPQVLRVSAPGHDMADASITVNANGTINVGVQLNSVP